MSPYLNPKKGHPMKLSMRVVGVLLLLGMLLGATAYAWGPTIYTWTEVKTTYTFLEADLRMALGIPARASDESVSIEVTTQRIPFVGMKYFFTVTHGGSPTPPAGLRIPQ
jgi:hypothetical protein